MKAHKFLFGLGAVLIVFSILALLLSFDYWQLFVRNENDRDLVEMIGFSVSVVSLLSSIVAIAVGLAAWMNRRA